MAEIVITQDVDDATLQRILHSRGGQVARDMYRRGRRVEGYAKRLVNVDTGRLRASIHTEQKRFGDVWGVRVGSDVAYARYVHDGTGLYGPRHVRIVPRNAKVLRWTTRGGKNVFARSTIGSKPNPFLRDALVAAHR